MRERRIDARATLHEAFDDAILERMKTDHREAPTGREHGKRSLKAACQRTQLIVDENAQRLKSTGGRVFARLARAHRARHERRKVARARERLLTACRHDRIRDASREPLLAKLRDHLANLVDARP